MTETSGLHGNGLRWIGRLPAICGGFCKMQMHCKMPLQYVSSTISSGFASEGYTGATFRFHGKKMISNARPNLGQEIVSRFQQVGKGREALVKRRDPFLELQFASGYLGVRQRRRLPAIRNRLESK